MMPMLRCLLCDSCSAKSALRCLACDARSLTCDARSLTCDARSLTCANGCPLSFDEESPRAVQRIQFAHVEQA